MHKNLSFRMVFDLRMAKKLKCIVKNQENVFYCGGKGKDSVKNHPNLFNIYPGRYL